MRNFKEYVLITIGVVLVAIGIEFFLAPNKIAAGGVSGMAIIINYYMPKISIGLLMLIMNVVLFIIAFIIIGNKFGGKTIYTSLSLSGIIWIIDRIMTPSMVVTKNLMLASLFGTFMCGIGLGIVFNQNASTGGTDILAKILNKFVHLDIGKSLLVVDFIITLFAAISFGADAGMYALLSVIINGFVIDTVIEGLNVSKQIMIISSQNDLISKFIIEQLERGCTLLAGKGGYTKEDTYILYTVLGRKEFIRLKKYIKEIDTRAFITINDAHEVLGEGFKDIIEH
ncbi:YitT family protein [Clostridiaceae bacterium UIB06]|uniref:YitT family protein n=1 Tax=Clostridium thailandense TaxID=2794346 RepID=A0A949X2Q4_9CLOT|nr:YitT family protein [Clostridium thailandense]MBV7271593.1 YitT family protein [Clostridium thailandense]MCH5136437.1 YitT family protein [Clostridiaceae bacterium UIB06]